MVNGMQKLDALTRILEVEPFDGMIIFARTKIATDELAQRLEARGFAAEARDKDLRADEFACVCDAGKRGDTFSGYGGDTCHIEDDDGGAFGRRAGERYVEHSIRVWAVEDADDGH